MVRTDKEEHLQPVELSVSHAKVSVALVFVNHYYAGIKDM